MKTRISKPYKEWAKEWGATHILQSDTFGRYFKCDSDGFGIMIKWHYSDDTDHYYLKWQSWWGNNKERPKMIKRYPVPDRDVYLEAETEIYIFDSLDSVMWYIKENNDKMIKVLKDNINKRLKKLVN